MATILVVEDDPLNADVITRLLQMHGHEVLVTDQGAKALEHARTAAPALILMDATLEDSEMDGWEITRRLKADPLTQAIPVIAVTAHVMPYHVERAKAVGCDGFIAKPINFAEVMGKINALLPS